MRDFCVRVSSALQARIVPGLEYSQTYYERSLRQALSTAKTWLDVGCGHRILPEWRGAEETSLVAQVEYAVGVDPDRDAASRHRTLRHVVCAAASALPFPDNTFDLVTANMVVEHLADPIREFKEIHRVLKTGGTFLFHTPNAESYVIQVARHLPESWKRALAAILEGRDSADVYPTHYLANTEGQIRAVAEGTGFAIEDVSFTLSTPTFQVIPPIAFFELLYLRRLSRTHSAARRRQTIICKLVKP